METVSKNTLTKCSLFIKTNMTNMNKVLDILHEKGCIEWEEMGEMREERCMDVKCQTLLDILVRRGGDSYKVFLQALESSGNKHIAMEIKNSASKMADEDKKCETPKDVEFQDIEKCDSQQKQLSAELLEKTKKLEALKEQHKRALEDIRKLKSKDKEKDLKIKSLEKRNQDLIIEIARLKVGIETLQKQVRRSDDERKRMESEHHKVLQSIDKKQDQILEVLACLQKPKENQCETEKNQPVKHVKVVRPFQNLPPYNFSSKLQK